MPLKHQEKTRTIHVRHQMNSRTESAFSNNRRTKHGSSLRATRVYLMVTQRTKSTQIHLLKSHLFVYLPGRYFLGRWTHRRMPVRHRLPQHRPRVRPRSIRRCCSRAASRQDRPARRRPHERLLRCSDRGKMVGLELTESPFPFPVQSLAFHRITICFVVNSCR
jgi:hypothetical protein